MQVLQSTSHMLTWNTHRMAVLFASLLPALRLETAPHRQDNMLHSIAAWYTKIRDVLAMEKLTSKIPKCCQLVPVLGKNRGSKCEGQSAKFFYIFFLKLAPTNSLVHRIWGFFGGGGRVAVKSQLTCSNSVSF